MSNLRLQYQLRAKTKPYQNRVTRSREIIAEALRIVRAPYVACSFGKDSSAMLHLVLEVAPDIPVRFLSWHGETDVIDDYERVIGWWQERGINLHVIEMARETLDAAVAERWQTTDYDGYFIGFRADESKGRRATLAYNGVIFRKADGLTRIAPLAWWSAVDVGAYTVEHGLPLLTSYGDDVNERTSSRIPREAFGIRERMLARLKARDPAAFNELALRFPEVRNYV